MIVAQPSAVCSAAPSPRLASPALECLSPRSNPRGALSVDWAIRAATWAQTRLLCRMPKCASAKRRGRAAVGMRGGWRGRCGPVQKPGPVVLELYRKPTVGRRPFTALCKRNARATNAAHHGLDMVLSGVRKGW